MLLRPPRFFYVSNAFEDMEKHARNIVGDSPAASGKVTKLCQAVRGQGGKAVVVSLGRGRQRGSWRWFPSVVRRACGVPIVYAAYLDAPVLTHFVSAISLLAIVLKISAPTSTLIFYNFLAYYIPSLIVSRFLKRRCLMDLEDGCRQDDQTIRGYMNRTLLKAHDYLCNGGAMVASTALIDHTSLRPISVCYGVVSRTDFKKNWGVPRLQVLFGGSLYKDTGAQLFIDAVGTVLSQYPGIGRRLKIVVTGFGDYAEKIKELASGQYSSILEYRGNVSSKEYLELLKESHIGLCLKLPDMSMGATTFPSKVVEMAAFGLLVVSTKVSDVERLFSEDTGVLLGSTTPEELAAALINIADSPEKYREVSGKGHAVLVARLSPEIVGTELLSFWRGKN